MVWTHTIRRCPASLVLVPLHVVPTYIIRTCFFFSDKGKKTTTLHHICTICTTLRQFCRSRSQLSSRILWSGLSAWLQLLTADAAASAAVLSWTWLVSRVLLAEMNFSSPSRLLRSFFQSCLRLLHLSPPLSPFAPSLSQSKRQVCERTTRA